VGKEDGEFGIDLRAAGGGLVEVGVADLGADASVVVGL
jgi:hypothetical protein